MIKPNFFIIGAPKCGTTSMAKFLGKHPQIFMSHPKEIHFFNTDHKIGYINSLEKYLDIFSDAKEHHIAIGEASTFYLYSRVAVKNILQFNPYAKFIVMLRNPVTMATSFHAEMYWSGLENIEDFETAWLVRNSNQLESKKVGYACKDSSLLQYENVCKLGEQVNRLLQIVDKRNVLFIVMDDIILNSSQECRRVFEFLGVDSNVEFKFEKANVSKRAKNILFRQIISYFGRVRKWYRLPRSLEILTSYIHGLNSRNYDHKSIRLELKCQLIEVFRDDINLLSSILDRDFSHWLEDEL